MTTQKVLHMKFAFLIKVLHFCIYVSSLWRHNPPCSSSRIKRGISFVCVVIVGGGSGSSSVSTSGCALLFKKPLLGFVDPAGNDSVETLFLSPAITNFNILCFSIFNQV